MFAKGFTIIELLVVMGIFAILATLSTLSLTQAQHSTSLNSTVNTLISDLKRQQDKAMIGDTEGRGTHSNYGIHFDSTDYVLFHDTYNVTDTTNFLVNLGGTLHITASNDIIFAKGSGESSATTITLSDTVSHQQKSLTINQYGVITALN